MLVKSVGINSLNLFNSFNLHNDTSSRVRARITEFFVKYLSRLGDDAS